MGARPDPRACRPLPTEIRQHCAIYFEEKTYAQAIQLLTSLLVSNNSGRPPLPAFVPARSTLALLATVLVHPSTTTRAQTVEARSACSSSHQYLRSLLAQFSPRASRLAQALIFKQVPRTESTKHGRDGINGSRRRSGKRQRISNGTSGTNTPRSAETSTTAPTSECSSDSNSDEARVIRNPLAGSAGLYGRAESFWSTVGWAFCCSIKYKHRWEYWRHWLELTLDILDADWDEQTIQKLPVAGIDNETAHVTTTDVESSLAMHYMAEVTASSRTAEKCVMRAIMATGSEQNMQEFPEIWRGETKILKAEGASGKHADPKAKKLDLDEGEMGDYAEQDEDESDDGGINLKRKSTGAGRLSKGRNAKRKREPGFTDFRGLDLAEGIDPKSFKDSSTFAAEPKDSIEAFGGHEALVLRRRLLSLLMRMTTGKEFVDNVAEWIRTLPVPVFAFFIAPSHNEVGPLSMLTHPTQVMLNCHLCVRLFSLNRTQLEDMDHNTIGTMIVNFLPFAAASAGAPDQARAALVLESLLRLTLSDAKLPPKEHANLRDAVMRGTSARRPKVEAARILKKGKEWRKNEKENEEASRVLRECEERIRWFVDCAAQK